MYAVIFKAKIARVDNEYLDFAERLRQEAMDKYGCKDFTSCYEEGYEITISYWDSEQSIKRWKQNADHRIAQHKGRSQWYRSYTVEVVELIRQYHVDNEDSAG